MARQEARFDVLAVDRDDLGEGPWWSEREQRLYWVDITGRRVRASDLDARSPMEWPAATEVGFVVPDTEGQLIAGLRHGLARLDPATGQWRDGVTVDRRRDHRINDGKTDRAGRLWFGSMHDPETDPTSRFYRFDAEGLTTIFDDVITSNGLGWSPDDRVMYYTDSKIHQIRAFDFDPATGEMSRPRVFAADTPGDCVPDGLTVDADGCVWGAKWDGGRVVRYAPDGRVLLELLFPVRNITSCQFAGPNLDTLVVTSARGSRDDEPLAGSVFLLDAGTTGRAEVPVPADIVTALGVPHPPSIHPNETIT